LLSAKANGIAFIQYQQLCERQNGICWEICKETVDDTGLMSESYFVIINSRGSCFKMTHKHTPR